LRRVRYRAPVDLAHLSVEILGGAIVGVSLGLMGAGGAILSIPIFTLMLGHGMGIAKFESLAVTGAIAAFSGIRAARAGSVDYLRFAAFALPGIAGTLAGGVIGKQLTPMVQAGIFAAFALVAAWRLVFAKEPASTQVAEPARMGLRTIALAALTGFLVGVLTGVIGVGGGFLLVPALVLISRLPMKRAAGTSLLVIAVNCVFGLVSNAINSDHIFDRVAWEPVAIIAGCGIAGSVLGAHFASRIPVVLLRKLFAAMLVLVAIGVVLNEAGVFKRPA